MAESIDGDVYVRYLAQFIRSNERKMAAVAQGSGKSARVNTGGSYFSMPSLPTAAGSRALTLHLTPHHLSFLLDQIESLGVDVGPMQIRLETLHDQNANNYVSFLRSFDASRRRGLSNDGASIRSVSSVQSVMSNVSNIWSRIAVNPTSIEKQKEARLVDRKYITSAMTKIPSLRLAPDVKSKVIEGYEEFPFDTAVPLVLFKNLTSLEIDQYDIRLFYGWHVLAENLRYLAVQGAQIDDLSELLVGIVHDDVGRRKRRPSRSGTTGGSPAESHAAISEMKDKRSRSSMSLRNHSSNTREKAGCSLQRSNTGDSSRSSGSNANSANGFETPSLFHTKWRFLNYLSVSRNNLTDLSPMVSMLSRSLLSLDLSSNLLAAMPSAIGYLHNLQSLNLSDNMIESIHALWDFDPPPLRTLILRGNRLDSLSGLERFSSLERVDLRDNRLTDPMSLARLTNSPNLGRLWVHGNPLCKRCSSTYRVTIFNIFREVPGKLQDITIDGSLPGLVERRSLNERISLNHDANDSKSMERAESPSPVPVKVRASGHTQKKGNRRRLVDIDDNHSKLVYANHELNQNTRFSGQSEPLPEN